MMHESELADPYMTPRSLPAQRPHRYLSYGIVFAVVLLCLAAGSLMVWLAIGKSPMHLDRGPPVRDRPWVEQNRGPVNRSTIEQPASPPETVVP